MELLEVQSFIDNNIFYREKWDEVPEDRIKQVIINNAEILLKRELPHHFNDLSPVPVDVLVEQCLHILERDDSHRRAEMGVSYFMASGLYLSFDKNFKDWTIAPAILKAYPRRKAGRYVYSRPDTFRRY